MPPLLSAPAERFLRTRLASPLQLDVLLLLHSDASRWWTPEAIAGVLRTAVNGVSSALEALATRNIVDVRATSALAYQYAPLDADVAATIDEVAAAHYRARDVVLSLVGRPAAEPPRAAERIADAFTLKRRKHDA